MKMKAALYYGAHDVRVEEVERPKAEDGLEGAGVVLKIGACGICNFKDTIRYKYTQVPPCAVGIALGHEYGGEVVEVGPNVTSVKVGDRVTGYAFQPCGKCESCLEKKYAACKMLTSGAGGAFTHGGMAEYILFPYVGEYSLTKLPDSMSFQESTMLEPLILGIGLAGKAKAGDTVVLIGVDLTALSTVAVLKEMGVKVIVSDVSKKRLDAAKEVGADVVVDENTEDIVRTVMKETNNEGAEVVIVTAIRPIDFTHAMEVVQLLGTIWMATEFDVPFVLQDPPEAERMAAFFRHIHFSIKCPWGTLGAKTPRMNKAIELIESGKISVEKHITHVFPIEKATEAFETAIDPYKTIKVVIEP